MARRSRRSLTAGRPGTPVEIIVRLLVVKRLYGWSYEALEHFVGDNLVLRQFCRIYQARTARGVMNRSDRAPSAVRLAYLRRRPTHRL
jgi:hypothetical protein